LRIARLTMCVCRVEVEAIAGRKRARCRRRCSASRRALRQDEEAGRTH
jgi:hypothetical protein